MKKGLLRCAAVLLLGVMVGISSVSFAAPDGMKEKEKEKAIKFKGKITAVGGGRPVNGKVEGIKVTVVDDAGQTLVFSVSGHTRVIDKTDKRPMQNVTIAPGRQVVVKYEVLDNENKARVIKLLE